MNHSQKTALITGGSQGIGAAIAKKFMEEGYHIVVFDMHKPSFESEYFQVDISKEKEIQEAVAQLTQVDVLINNAGIYFMSFVEDTEEEDLERMLSVNIKGAYLMCKHVLPLLRASKGTIVNIASVLGVVPEPESPAYCMTKAAIIMLTKCMSQKYIQENIRVNAVLPGPIDTPLLRNSFADLSSFNAYLESKPMKCIGQPEDVAEVVYFLASEKAGFINGAQYSVDGGESASSWYSK